MISFFFCKPNEMLEIVNNQLIFVLAFGVLQLDVINLYPI